MQNQVTWLCHQKEGGTLIWSPEVEVSAACKMITTHHRESNEDVNNKMHWVSN
jgi:hypothetical protein